MPPLETTIYIALAVNLVVSVFFCLTLRGALLQVSEHNRALSLSSIWLLIIPVLSLIWIFIVIHRMSQSLQNELEERNFEVDEKPGYNIGMSYAIIAIILNFPFPALLQFIFAIAGILFFIQYWMKINWYKKLLLDDAEQGNVKDL